MTSATQHNEITTIFPVGSLIKWDFKELPFVCEQLISITKNVELRTRNLELAIKSMGNKDKKSTMEANLHQIVSKWHDNCKRLGAIPIGMYRCKILMNGGQIMYWEYPKGLIAPPTDTIQ